MKTKKIGIGLDIGSSAVRAAEVSVTGERRVLRRFAQVGLEPGAVVEGEVRDPAAVSEAIKKLWQHGGFSGKKVVLGLGSQRAMVRQVEMPPMADDDLRSALQFKVGEFLPIPVEQAVFDFAPLPAAEDADDKRRVLMMAAQRDVVVDEVAAVEKAGLRVEAVDSTSLALLRAVSQDGPDGPSAGTGGGLEAVVGIGAELVTVVVRQDGAPRFIRTVALAGPASTRGSMDPKGGPGGGGPVLSRAGQGGVTVSAPLRLDAIITEVRSSLEYLLSQTGTARFERVLLTGGGAMLPGVTEALTSAVGLPVQTAGTPVELDRESLALDDAALEEASYRWMSAVGLALWGTDAYGRPSLLPKEVLVRRQQRAVMLSAVGGIAVVAVALGSVSVSRLATASHINNQISAANAEAVSLQAKINGLNYVLKVPAEVQAERAMGVNALAGDIDWLGTLQRIAAAMPGDVTPTTVSLTKTAPMEVGGSTATPAAVTTTGPTIVGTVSLDAQTTHGAAAVAQFIDRLSQVKGLYELWVQSTTSAGGLTTIEATAEMTSATLSHRAAALPGGNK